MSDLVAQDSSESIWRECTITEDGRVYLHRNALARLCGVQTTQISRHLLRGYNLEQKTPESLAVRGQKGVTKLVSDVVASEVILHFAVAGNAVAQQTLKALGAVGLRKTIQAALDYSEPRKKLSNAQVIELCCLPVPCDWQRRFPEEYYEELSRLTGLEQFGNSRPALWAQKTKELVYDYLPPCVYNEIKRCKTETGSYDKLHQFLADDGLKILEQHQRTLLTLMQASATMHQLKTLLTQSCHKSYQLMLVQV